VTENVLYVPYAPGMLVPALLGYTLNRGFLSVDARLMAWHRRR